MSNKKKIRLTESEMVTLVENIVNQVKLEKKRKINESRKPSLLRERQYRLLMEATQMEIEADLEEIGEDEKPENAEKEETLLDKIEKFIEEKKLDLKRLGKRAQMILKRMMHSSHRPIMGPGSEGYGKRKRNRMRMRRNLMNFFNIKPGGAKPKGPRNI